jgi:hypothetical protein
MILQKIYYSLEDRFFNLYKNLIEKGYHFKCWRKIIEVVLRKENRKVSISKSYRIISLLNCMRKVAKKIIATRLLYLDSNILNFDQLDDRK